MIQSQIAGGAMALEKKKVVVFKVSGEMLGASAVSKNLKKDPGHIPDRGVTFDPPSVEYFLDEISDVIGLGLWQIVLVIGAGNFGRGADFIFDPKDQARTIGLTPNCAHTIGMILSTVNVMAFVDKLEQRFGEDAVEGLSALKMEDALDLYRYRTLARKLKQDRERQHNRLYVIGGGLGYPGGTTDNAAVTIGVHIGADLVIKGTKVNGVYDKDPKKHTDAKHIARISYQDFLHQNLRILDKQAVALASDSGIPIQIYNAFERGGLRRLLEGDKVGSVIDMDGE